MKHFAVLEVCLSRTERTQGADRGMMYIYDSTSQNKEETLRRWALHTAAVRKLVCGFGKPASLPQPTVVDVIQQDGLAMDCAFHALL